jgi:hypothetical protein
MVTLLTPMVGIEMTSSLVAPEVRRNVPVHSTDAGSVDGHPEPLTIVPPHVPNSGSLAAWLIVTVCPAMVSVPVRVSPGFSLTVNDTLPLPVCVDVGVTVTKFVLFVTDHVHVLPVVTENVALPPEPAMLNDDVETEYVHTVCAGGDGRVGESEHADNPNKPINKTMSVRTVPSTLQG